MCIFKAASCEDLHLFKKKLHTSVCLCILHVCLFNYIFFKTKGCIIIGATWLLQREKKNNASFPFFNSWSCTFYTEFRTVYIQMYSYISSDVWCEMHARSYLLICSRGKHIPSLSDLPLFFLSFSPIYGDICDALF